MILEFGATARTERAIRIVRQVYGGPGVFSRPGWPADRRIKVD
jgi:hypothetical protein